jgi:hypothetical protein
MRGKKEVEETGSALEGLDHNNQLKVNKSKSVLLSKDPDEICRALSWGFSGRRAQDTSSSTYPSRRAKW